MRDCVDVVVLDQTADRAETKAESCGNNREVSGQNALNIDYEVKCE